MVELGLIVDFLLEAVKYILLLNVIFGTKTCKKWFAGVMAGIFTGLVLAGILPIDNLTEMPYFIVSFSIITLLVIDKESVIRRIMHAGVLMILGVTLDSSVGTLVRIVIGNTRYSQIPTEVSWMIVNSILIFALVIIYWVQKKELVQKSKVLQVLLKVILYLCIAIMMIAIPFTITGLTFFAEQYNNPVLERRLQIVTDIFLFSMVALVLFIIYVNNTNKKIKKYLEMEKTLKDTQKNYYEAMLAKEDATRRFRHDVLNHLIVLGELTKQGEMKPVADYVQEIQGNMVEIQQRCYSIGNTIIDAFLNYYIQMLEEDVEVSVTGCLTQRLSISDVELCTIFSNLIKNSVEELKKPSENKKYLKIKVDSGQQAFRIEISNSISKGKEELQGSLPKTTKRDKKNHGIGLRNVKETVEKNQGIFEWKTEENCFGVIVTLPLMRNE